MSEESKLREQLCSVAAHLFDRGLTHGATGNVSVRLPDGSLLVSPTGATLGQLDPAELAVLDSQGNPISGPKPTKEWFLHQSMLETRGDRSGAVIHLHSCYSVALSTLPGLDPDDVIPRLTAYGIMQLGRVKLLPFFVPGDRAMGEAIRGLAGKRSAVLLAHHGPVVAGRDLTAAQYAIEELEASSKLALITQGLSPQLLNEAQTQSIVKRFNLEWDE